MANSRITLWLTLTINLCLKAAVALRSLKFIDGLTIPDDSYLSLTIARNIARGLGPLYGPDYTDGFQPLFVFLMAPVYKLFPHSQTLPVHIALVILISFDTVTLYLLYKLIRDISNSEYTPLIIAAFWIFSPITVATSNNGLETSLSMFFIILAYYRYRQLRDIDCTARMALFIWGIILGLAALARIDNLILAFVLILGIIWNRCRAGGYAAVLRGIVYPAAGMSIILFPWLLYIYGYTHSLYPVSGEAVRFMNLAIADHNPTLMNFVIPMLWLSFRALWDIHWVILIAIILFSIILYFRDSRTDYRILLEKVKRHSAIMIFSALLYCSYTFYIYGAFYFARYLYPLILFPLICLAILVDSALTGITIQRVRLALVTGVVSLLAIGVWATPNFRSLFLSTDTQSMGYMNLGIWARSNFPDSTVVGSSQSGALGYFAENLKVVNLDGVVNRRCFESLKARRNMRYIKETGIQYVVGWDSNIDFLKRHSVPYKETDLIPMGKVAGFKTWKDDWYLFRVNYDSTNKITFSVSP